MISDKDRKKALNAVIATQCFGLVAGLCFVNGLIFNYLNYLKVSEESLVVYLRIPSILALFTILPLAYIADRKGKIKIGQLGNFIQVLGIACLCSAAYISGFRSLAVLGGIILFSFGASMVNGSWFALLDPIVKPEQRGSFFAKLRTFWQLFGVLFTFGAQFILELKGDVMLSPILMFVVILGIIRMYFYSKIPELELNNNSISPAKSSLITELKKILKYKSYVQLCIFILVMPLFMGSITLIFNLYEQNILKFSSADIVLMGNMVMIGAILGYAVGAFLLKKLGDKLLFLMCSVCISLCSVLFTMHEYFSFVPVKLYAGMLTLCTSLSISSMSIGITALMLHLLPKENKSLSTSLFLTAQEMGTGISAGILSFTIAVYGQSSSRFASINVNVYTVTLLVIAILFPLAVWGFNKILEDSNT